MFPIVVLLAELVLCILAFATLGFFNGCGALLLIALTLVFFYYAAKNKQQASFVDQDTIEFVVKGNTLTNVLENIPGWHYQKTGGLFPIKKPTRKKNGAFVKIEKVIQYTESPIAVEEALVPNGALTITNSKGKALVDPSGAPLTHTNKKDGVHWYNYLYLNEKLREWLGFFWVSALYPQWRVHSFPVSHLRIRPESAIRKDDTLEKWLDSSVPGNKEGENTTFEKALLWKFPRPVLVQSVEFSDLFVASILLQGNFQIVKPRPFVFTWGKDFFPMLGRAIQAATIDYLRQYENGYQGFIQSGVTGSQSEFFWNALDPLNHGERGLIQEFGVYLRDAWVVQIQLSKEDERASNALKAKKIAELEGKAEVTAATYRKTAATKDAAALGSLLGAVRTNPEILEAKFAVDIAKLNIQKADKIKSGVTWVEAGAIQIKK